MVQCSRLLPLPKSLSPGLSPLFSPETPPCRRVRTPPNSGSWECPVGPPARPGATSTQQGPRAAPRGASPAPARGRQSGPPCRANPPGSSCSTPGWKHGDVSHVFVGRKKDPWAPRMPVVVCLSVCLSFFLSVFPSFCLSFFLYSFLFSPENMSLQIFRDVLLKEQNTEMSVVFEEKGPAPPPPQTPHRCGRCVFGQKDPPGMSVARHLAGRHAQSRNHVKSTTYPTRSA